MIQDVCLVLFFVRHLSFGVLAEQVEELVAVGTLNEQAGTLLEYTISYKGQAIRVINFSKWIENEQPSRVKLQEPGDEVREKERHLHSPEYQKGDERYRSSPKIMIMKQRDKGYIGVRIDGPEDLVTISINQVHSLPVIMQKTKRIQGLWGIAFVNNRPVILIDFTQL